LGLVFMAIEWKARGAAAARAGLTGGAV